MTRAQLNRLVEERTNASYSEAQRGVRAVFDTIAAELESGRSVQISGFGTFEVRTHAARQLEVHGRTHSLPARRIAKFVASQAMKRALNERRRRR